MKCFKHNKAIRVRILAWVLTMSLLLTFTPTLVFAEEGTDDNFEEDIIDIIEENMTDIFVDSSSVAIHIALNEYGGTELFLDGCVPVTYADLLAGVTAEDENGDPVHVIVADVNELDMANPQPRPADFNTGMVPPYIITYEAAHPITGEAFTAEREAYVSVGFTPTATVDVGAGAGAIQSAIDGYSGSGGTVTVTGNGMFSGNTLNIPANVTVEWAAQTEGLLSLTGAGTFAVVNGGSISRTFGVATIYSNNASNALTIEVRTGGSVSMTTNEITSSTIRAEGAGDQVIVNGGTVTGNFTTGSNPVIISTFNSGMSVTVNGGGKVQATNAGHAIRTYGDVLIDGNTNAEVSSILNDTIRLSGATSKVTVSGGTVTNDATDNNNPVINITGNSNTGLNVEVTGTGKVLATAGAIAINTPGSVKIDGNAEVSATTRSAILATGANSVVTVSGGTVKNEGRHRYSRNLYFKHLCHRKHRECNSERRG